MRTADLVMQLCALGATLRVDGDRLVCDAPRGALTDDVREAIRTHKPELVRALEEAGELADDGPPLLRLSRQGGLPPGLVQQRMWVLQALDPDSTVYNLPGAWRLAGPLDVDTLRTAFTSVVDRQEVMRARFTFADGDLLQTFDAVWDDALPLIDLSELPESRRESAMNEAFEAERAKRFDLGVGPQWVARLVRMGPEDHVFFFMPHHLIWDGWCFDILLDDLRAEYEALLDGRPSPLSPLPVQYADYVLWHRALMGGAEGTRQLEFWRRALSGSPELLSLPTDRPRPEVLTDRGDRVLFRVDSGVVDALAAVGRGEGATLFMTVFAVFRVLLHQLSGQHDVTVGVPIQNRLRAEAERLFGVFVNTLVVPTQCTPTMTFRSLLRDVRDSCIEAFDHQDVPFEMIVEELKPRRSQSHTPLFQTLFTFQDIKARPGGFGEAEVSQHHVDVRVAPTDLLFGFMVSKSGALGVLDFATDLFDRSSVERWSEQLRMLFGTVASEGVALDDPISSFGSVPGLRVTAPTSGGQEEVGGLRIDVEEIEATLREHESVERAAAVVLGSGTDARLAVFVILDERASTTGSELRRFVRSKLPAHMVPGLIQEVDHIPLTPEGDVDRRRLRDPDAGREVPSFMPPSSPVEIRIADVWRNLLGVDEVGLNDNFFDLGGHSLLAIQAVAKLREDMGLRVDPRTFFFNSLQQIAEAAQAPASERAGPPREEIRR